jgi:hypothetical protein
MSIRARAKRYNCKQFHEFLSIRTCEFGLLLLIGNRFAF